MRYFLATSFICLALVMSVAGVAPAAHAQDGEISNTSAPTVVQGDIVAPTPVGAAPTPAAASTGGAGIPTPNLPGIGADPSLFSSVMIFIMSLFAWLMGVAVVLLDNAVFYGVVTMGDYIHKLGAINVAWTVLRDVGNIALIFGFLAVGITVILNVDWYGGGKKLLPMLIMAAVFLNFSLFISEAVIDVGNLFATQFYTQINGGTSAGNKNLALASVTNEGISNAIMSQLGLATIYGGALAGSGLSAKALKASNTTFIAFMGSILFIVAAFVMFSLAFILIARLVILILLIILSPVGIAGLAIPKLQNSANLWWHTLFEQVFIAPVLLLLLYVALRVITAPTFLIGSTSNGSWDSFVKGDFTGFAGLLLSFLVAMGLLLAVVLFAKKMSAFGAGWATSMGGKLSFGATAWAGRRTVGRASNASARWIRSSKLGRTETGRLLAGFADRGAKASFDVRATSALKSFPGGGIDAGTAQKGGYKAREDELVKARIDYAKGLKQTADEKAKEAEHKKNIEELGAEEKALVETNKELIEASKEELKLKRQELEDARKSGNSTIIGEKEYEYNLVKDKHADLVKTQQGKLDPIRRKIAEERISLGNVTAAPQIQYGKVLEKREGVWKAAIPYDWSTAVGGARREAAGKILGESRKDKNTKLTERLEAILEKEEKLASGSPGSGGGEEKKPSA